MKRVRLALSGIVSLLLPSCAGVAAVGEAGGDGGLPSVAEATRELLGFEGFVPLWWDAEGERLFLEVPPPDVQLLYVESLPGGLGSNDVGLDRGQIGDRRLVEFRRHGPRVLLVAPNLDWRAGPLGAGDGAVERGVRDSFAESVLWGFSAAARDPDGRTLVDATEFFLRDAHGVVRRLEETGQGAFRLEPGRSAILGEDLAAFPENSEVEVLLTFVGEDPGPEVRATTPDPHAVSLRVRHSLVALPALDGSFRPRRFDPRSGYFPLTFRDPTKPVDQPLEERWIHRHRLSATEPIVYHVDRAAPEPVRTALLEGARYWAPVFAAAGHPDGFRVELLPEDADPLDARYNVIQWVNRSTRGWSYGDAVADPRTGEILKGHVTLGALRVRQDLLLFEGLVGPWPARGAPDPRPLAAALARIRQLSAHEVGHTLGLAHNFAASADGRASVMDYPAPLVRLDASGEIDLADAYREGCGPWDELTIRYGYAALPAGVAEADALERVLATAEERGLRWASDLDARGPDRAHPVANLWDNGADAVTALRESYRVRRAALERFSPAVLPPGRPLGDLEQVLVPLYLHHRYQLEAAVRQVGGVAYTHAVRTAAPAPPIVPVPARRQDEALEAVLDALEPGFLAMPAHVLALVPPPAPGTGRGRESFEPGGLLLDPLGPARIGAELALGLLLDPGRARRLVDQARLDPDLPSLREVLTRLMEALWNEADEPAPERAVRLAVRALALEHLIGLEGDDGADVRVRARALEALVELRARVSGTRGDPDALWERERLRRFFDFPTAPGARAPRPRVPPGSPIGCGEAPVAGPFPAGTSSRR